MFVCVCGGERGDGKRDAESIDVCLCHVADRGGVQEVRLSIRMCVLTAYPT